VKVFQLNNSVIFNRESMGFREFLSKTVGNLGITIDRRPIQIAYNKNITITRGKRDGRD